MRQTSSCVGLVGLLVSACTGAIDGEGDETTTPPATDVQIVVRDGSAPQANVRVLFQNPDDSLVAEAFTDASGQASAEMPAGGTLTVIRMYPAVAPEPAPPPEIFTYVGVKAGDRLELGRPTAEMTSPSAIIVKVPETAQGTVTVMTSCGEGQGTAPYVPITVASCPAMVDFYVKDQGQSSFFKRAPYAENVDLSGEALLGNLSATLSATNVPADTTVNVEQRIVAGTFELYSSGTKRVDAQPATVNMPSLEGVDQLVITTIDPANLNPQVIAEREPYAGAPVIVDASIGLLPSVSEPSYEPTQITWVEQGTGTADAVVATLTVTRDNSTDEYVRHIIGPHNGSLVRVPQLPATYALYNPGTNDSIGGALGIVQAVGGYDAIRARAFAVARIVEAAPSNGRVTLSYAGGTPPGQ